MQNSNKRKPTDEQVKEYLVALSDEIIEIGKDLREELEKGNSISINIYLLISRSLLLDLTTDKKYHSIFDDFLNCSLAEGQKN